MPIALLQPLRRFVTHVPLRWVLTVPFVVPTIGAVVLVGYLSYRNGQEAVVDLGHQLVAGTNDRVTQELKTYLQTPLLINRLNVDAVNQGQIDPQNVSELETALFNRLQQFEQVSAVLFVNPQGTFRVVERSPDLYLGVADPPRPDQVLVYRLDSQGKRGQRIHTGDGVDVRRDRPWYQRAVTTGQPGWNQIFQDGASKTLTLDASQPVYDRSTNRLLGVFSVNVRLDYLSEFLHRLPISRSGQVIILDQSGALIATSTQEQPYRIEAGTGSRRQFKQLNIDQSHNDLTRSLGEYLRDRPGVLKSLDQSHHLNFSYNGEQQFVKITPFQDQYGLNWQIVTVIPESHFLGAVQNHSRQTLLLCLLTLGVALTLGLLAADKLTTHFAQLNRVSRALAAGHLDQRMPTASPIYELNSLAQTFNQTAEQLQQSFDRIKTALEESEEKFATIFRNSPDPMAIASLAEGCILEGNDSLIEFFGYSRSEMIGRTALELNLWSSLDQRHWYRALLQQQGSIRNLEAKLCTKSGEVKTVLLSAEVRPLAGQDCVIVVYRDISNRKAAEVALQRYERIVSATTDAISLVDRQYRYQMVNQTYLDWNHKSYTEIVGHSANDLVGQEVFETVIQPCLDRCLAGETIQYHEWFEFPVLGRQFLSVTYSPYLEVDQTISGIVVSARNITPLKQAEAALQASEARFQEIAQTLNQVSYVVSLTTGQYLYISPAYERLWGYSCESLYQNPSSWLERIHPEDLDYVSWGFNQLLSGNPVRLQYRIIGANGEVHWIESESLVVYDEDGNPLRMVGCAEDITDRKQLEQSLRTQAEEERLLTSITQNIRQSLDLEQILATTVVEVQQTLKADRVLIFQLHQDGSGQVIQEAVLPEYPIIKQMHWLDECFPDECYAHYQQGTPRIVPDVATDQWTSCLAAFMQEAGVKSKVVAPIVQVGEASSPKVWGLLIVHACSHCRQWQESEADFLQKICNQLAIAIDQANLYQQLQTELAERKQAEAALRQSEARLAIAQQVAQVGYWEFDFASQTRTWSEITFPQWGLDPTQPEPTWAELLQMVHPDDRAALQQNREKTITEGIPYALDLRVVHPDGSIRYLDSRAEPLFDAQGQIVKLIGTSVDITERKQTEKALQEREAMLRAIGDNLPKGFIYQRVYEPGKGFYYSYVSAGIERLLGIKPEALLENSKIIREVGFDEDLALADRLVQASLKHLSIVEIQMRNRTAQGDIQWSSIRSIPRRLDDGRTVWDGVEVDITELKRIEAALRASEELFRRAFDDAPIGISLVSTTGQFVKVNSRYCDLLGYTEAELLSLTFPEITHPADIEKDLAGFQQMMAGEIRSFQMEKRYITRQGTVLPVLMNAALIRDQNEQPLYCVGQVQDIRDRLKVERMKDEFISITSHELRTPLTSIRGALGILGSGVFNDRPEKAQHMLQIAITNSDRLVRLVDDILSLERLESGKVQLVMEQCQVQDLMQQAIDGVQAIADQSDIILSCTPLSITLSAAPDAIMQTLINLLGNAIKFSSPGDTVWLRAEMGNRSPTPSIFFSITDQGRGIPADKLEVIFEQFQQVDVSDARKKGGTGLGLAICKSIVQQHGGQIWAESVLGQGSTFYFALPLTGKGGSNRESD